MSDNNDKAPEQSNYVIMPPVMSGNLGTVSGGFTTSTIVLPPSNLVIAPNDVNNMQNNIGVEDSFDADERKKQKRRSKNDVEGRDHRC